MKKVLFIFTFLLGLGALANGGITPNLQTVQPITINLSESWIQSHFDAQMNRSVIEVYTEEMAYSDAEISLVNISTGLEYKFLKGEMRSKLNISDLPNGNYFLKIVDDLLFESLTSIRIE